MHYYCKHGIKIIYGLLSLGYLILLLEGCRHTPEIPESPSVSFAKDVQPIMISNCAQSGCHDGFEMFGLNSYDEISQKTTPGNAHQSSIYTSIVKRSMPPTAPLSDQQAKLIYTWIMQGSKNN
jgi:hypothetical protein